MVFSEHFETCKPIKSKFKSVFEPSGSSGWHLSLLSMTQSDKENFHSPLDWKLVHQRVTPGIKFVSSHTYTWDGERERL